MEKRIDYCGICDKEYEFIPVTRTEIFHVDEEETIEFEAEMLCCPVCGNGRFMKPTIREIEKILHERRVEKGVPIVNGKWKNY